MHELETDDDWRDRAECLTADPNVMQPDRPTTHLVDAAKAYCRVCPVLAECKAETRLHPAYGVWAGEWHGPYDPPAVADVLDAGEWAEFMREGLTDGEIARRLGLSREQVRYYRQQTQAA